MRTSFFKYHGAGNDFILIHDRTHEFPSNDSAQISRLCDRRFGIGADGIVLIQKSDKADFLVDFLNPDGSRSFCGNGSRCALRFADSLGIVSGAFCTFEAYDGVHTGWLKDDSVRISMADVNEIQAHPLGAFLYTGSPHLVISYQGDLDTLDVKTKGAGIRYDTSYEKEGVNVNFIKERSKGHIAIRTYERGVEDETLSCGSGVTAAALAYVTASELEIDSVKVDARGGNLKVEFLKEKGSFKNIVLEGPAELVFSGEVEIKR